MSNALEYNGYIGRIELPAEDKCFHGKIEFINDLVTFEVIFVEKLETEFKAAFDDSLKTCEELNINPRKSFKGTENCRPNPTP